MFGPKFQQFRDNANAWMTPERAIAMQGIGMGLSQLAAGQPVNLSPAHQALMERQQSAKMRDALEGSGLMDRFTPDQRAILAQMEPQAAQSILLKTLFAPPPEPVKGVEINGQLVNPLTGELIGDYRDPEEGPKPIVINGQLVDPVTREVLGDYRDPDDPTPTGYIATGKDAEALGLDPTQAYNITVDQGQMKATQIGGNGTSINIDNSTAADDKFGEASAKYMATMLGTLTEQGAQAQAELGQIAAIEELLSGVGGTADAWRSWAQNTLGVSISGGQVEALNAAINKLVPQQRPPGSGQMSDRDVQLFKESLPQLINSEEGNRIIVETMRGLAEFKRKQGEIAAQALIGRMTREDALDALYALGDPLADARVRIEALKSGNPSKEDLLKQAQDALNGRP